MLILITPLLVPAAFAGNDDSNNKEIGIEWVNDYSGPGLPFIPNTDDCARGFYNTLGNNGFTRNFDYGNSSAQERHWEKSSVEGQDTSYVETVDFVYFAGHGDEDEFWFGVNTDGGGSYPYRVHHSGALWGDVDLEWVFLKACEVLKESGQADWHAVYDNVGADLHGICGFHSSAYDTKTLGSTSAQYLLQSYSIKAAWKTATSNDQHQYGTVWGAIQARELINIYTGIPFLFYGNETMPGYGGGMYNDPSYYSNSVYYKTWYYERWLC